MNLPLTFGTDHDILLNIAFWALIARALLFLAENEDEDIDPDPDSPA